MTDAEFDAVAADYSVQHAASIRLSGEGVDFFAEYKTADARRSAESRGLAIKTILDFGSGIGSSLQPMRKQFPDAHITCLDVSEKSLKLCKSIGMKGVEYRSYDGYTIPSDIGSFDMVFTACVFHHIDGEIHVSLLNQLRTLLSPGGFLILFEHNPWNPLTRHAVNICPFDKNAVLIAAPEMKRRFRAAGFKDLKTSYRIFFPGALAALRTMEPALAWLPMGAQYSLAAT